MLKGDRGEKFAVGPRAPREGPTLLMQVRVVTKDSVKSNTSSDTTSVPAIRISRYAVWKACAEVMARSSTGWPSMVITETRLGWRMWSSSRRSPLTSSSRRLIFMPPAVEPAQEPIYIRPTRMQRLNVGHRAKSFVEKPVVLITVAAWKEASVTDSYHPCPSSTCRLMQIRTMLAARMPRYQRSSSLRKAVRNLPQIMAYSKEKLMPASTVKTNTTQVMASEP